MNSERIALDFISLIKPKSFVIVSSQLSFKQFKNHMNTIFIPDLIFMIWNYYVSFYLRIEDQEETIHDYRINLNCYDLFLYRNYILNGSCWGNGTFINSNMEAFRVLNGHFHLLKNNGIDRFKLNNIINKFKILVEHKTTFFSDSNTINMCVLTIDKKKNKSYPLKNFIKQEMYDIIKRENKLFFDKDKKYHYILEEKLNSTVYVGSFNQNTFDAFVNYGNECIEIDNEFRFFIKDTLSSL